MDHKFYCRLLFQWIASSSQWNLCHSLFFYSETNHLGTQCISKKTEETNWPESSCISFNNFIPSRRLCAPLTKPPGLSFSSTKAIYVSMCYSFICSNTKNNSKLKEPIFSTNQLGKPSNSPKIVAFNPKTVSHISSTQGERANNPLQENSHILHQQQ